MNIGLFMFWKKQGIKNGHSAIHHCGKKNGVVQYFVAKCKTIAQI